MLHPVDSTILYFLERITIHKRQGISFRQDNSIDHENKRILEIKTVYFKTNIRINKSLDLRAARKLKRTSL